MTGRTHDLAAFTALNLLVANNNSLYTSLPTAIVSVSANLIGGLSPDLDESTSKLWHDVPAGSFVGQIISPLLGGHRMISHSIVGLVLFSLLVKYLLSISSHVLIVDDHLVWWSFMIGYASHLITDTITKEGVPWLFPIPIRFGIPPFKFLRIKTGSIIEKVLIFPGLLFLNFYIVFTFYPRFLDFVHHL